MKTLAYLISGFVLILFAATCNRATSQNDGMTVTGTIQEQGITSYQYGTHTLTNSDVFYAVKSDSLDLNDYLNREVTVRVRPIEGYPIEGGPEYLEVLEVVE